MKVNVQKLWLFYLGQIVQKVTQEPFVPGTLTELQGLHWWLLKIHQDHNQLR